MPQPVDLKPVEPKPVEPKPVEPKPVEPKPVEPKPVEPKPVEPKPVEPKPVEPKPVEPKPVEPKPVEPKPVEPKPVGPKPVEPKPVEPKPVEPKPVEPKPVEPKPVEPKPVEPKPVEPKPVEPKPVEPKPVEPKPVEPKPVEPKPVEPKPVEPKPVEPKPVEPKPVEPKPVEPKPVEPKPVEPADFTYLAPLPAERIVKPVYPANPVVNEDLRQRQPQPSRHTKTGYSYADARNGSNITTAWYGVNEAQYAEQLQNLKNSINTFDRPVGVIDSGIDPNNLDMVGAQLHPTNVVRDRQSGDYRELPIAGRTPSNSHGSQMAAIIAGNHGYTNATIYGSDSIGSASNGGNQFEIMRLLNTNHGVKIFNNSWGSMPANYGRWTDWQNRAGYDATTGLDTSRRYRSDLPVIRDLIVNRDALIIKSTGNEGHHTATDETLAPNFDDRFKHGFIAVSSPREDFANANLCGEAARWCLASPSSSRSYQNDETAAAFRARRTLSQGTSPAAARVTATAVLVSAKYPWMKNKNIVETILGTTKDFASLSRTQLTRLGGRQNIPWESRTVIENIGGKNITRESGWGLLDTLAASKGYGGFYWNDVVLDTNGTPSSLFSNNIGGNHGFTKRGEGKLILAGNNSYRGDTKIEGGTLQIDGDNGPSTMKLAGGELTGFGKVAAIDQNGGWVDNSGNLTVGGDYTANIADNADAGLKVKMGNLLNVEGKAKVGGILGLSGEAEDGFITEAGVRSTVLRADKGVEGAFSSYRSFNELFEVTKVAITPKVDANGQPVETPLTPTNTATKPLPNTDVQVSAKRKKVTTVADNGVAMAGKETVAAHLDTALRGLDARVEAGETLTPVETAFANRVSRGFVRTESSFDKDGVPLLPVNLSANQVNKTLYRLDASVYANANARVLASQERQNQNLAEQLLSGQGKNAWLTTLNRRATAKDGPLEGERHDYSQQAGMALPVGEAAVLGIQFSHAALQTQDRYQGDVPNTVDSRGAGLAVGLGTDWGRGMHTAAWISGTQWKNKVSRAHGDARTVNFDHQVYGAGVRVAKDITVSEQTDLTPQAGLSYTHARQQGGQIDDGVNTVHDTRARQLTAMVGVQAGHQLTPVWRLSGHLNYERILNHDIHVHAAYNGSVGHLPFTAWDVAKNRVAAGVRSEHRFGEQTRLHFMYGYQAGRKTRQHSLDAVLKRSF